MLDMPKMMFSGHRVYRGYGSRANAKAYLVDCIRRNVPDFEVPANDRELVFQGWDALCHRFAQPVFFEKSPQFLAHWASLSLMLEWIQSTEFTVRIIGLTRNPLSVLYSAEKLFHTDPEARQYGWMAIQKNLLSFQAVLSEGSFLGVQYENVIESPIETFRQVCEFIGISYHDDVGKNVHSRSLNKWKDDPAFTVRLDESVKQLARCFGYTDDELDNPMKPEPARLTRCASRLKAKAELARACLRDRILRPLRLRLRPR